MTKVYLVGMENSYVHVQSPITVTGAQRSGHLELVASNGFRFKEQTDVTGLDDAPAVTETVPSEPLLVGHELLHTLLRYGTGTAMEEAYDTANQRKHDKRVGRGNVDQSWPFPLRSWPTLTFTGLQELIKKASMYDLPVATIEHRPHRRLSLGDTFQIRQYREPAQSIFSLRV